jgi:hypothetical protein
LVGDDDRIVHKPLRHRGVFRFREEPLDMVGCTDALRPVSDYLFVSRESGVQGGAGGSIG